MLLHTNSTMIVRRDRKDANARYAEGAGIEVKRNHVCRRGWHKSMQGFRKYFLPELQGKLCSNHPLTQKCFQLSGLFQAETWLLLSSNFDLLMLLQEDDHLIKETASSISGHQQGVKRKADMPLGSPLEPGQILEKNEDSKVKLKIRVRNGNSTCTICRVFGMTAMASADFP